MAISRAQSRDIGVAAASWRRHDGSQLPLAAAASSASSVWPMVRGRLSAEHFFSHRSMRRAARPRSAARFSTPLNYHFISIYQLTKCAAPGR